MLQVATIGPIGSDHATGYLGNLRILSSWLFPCFREREKNELKSRIEELEGYKDKCNDLQQENEVGHSGC